MPSFNLRAVTLNDAAAITAIYAPYVIHSCCTFEDVAPDVSEMRARIDKILKGGFPYYVAESGGRVIGYAYASPFHTRSAYRYVGENSVYMDEASKGQGVGKALMQKVIADCEAMGLRQMIARITDDANGAKSIRLHERLGFETVGRLKAVGFKFGGWVDVVEMQLALGAGDRSLPE